MTVSIIVPNWNGRELLQKHLPAVIAETGKSEVIVVDDASTDDSIGFLRRQFPNVGIVAKDRHDGFASTVNAGVAEATGEVVVLLNTDCEPEKNFLQKLLPHFDDPLVFAVGSMDKSIEGDRTMLRGRGIAHWRRGLYVHRRGAVNSSKTDWVSGGSGAFRKSMWDKLGGMDTLFNPFYWEDIDLSHRAIKAGFSLVFESGSVVRHFHQEGKIMSKYSTWQVRMISTRNQFQFIWKNISGTGIIVSHMFWTPITLLKAVFTLDSAFIYGYVAAMTRLPLILARRKSLS